MKPYLSHMIELARRLGKEKHDTSKQEGQDSPGVAPLSFPDCLV